MVKTLSSFAIILPLFLVASAHAAPQCSRPAQIRQSVVPVNSFAQSSAPQAIVPGRGRCGWAIGLAEPGNGTGTAFLVGHRREVMTNLHVVDKDCRGNRRFIFSHGFDRGRSLSKETATVVIHGDYCAKLAHGRHDYSGDWAIAVLEEDPAELEDMSRAGGALPLQPRTGEWLKDNGRYFLLGYGMSFRQGRQPYRSAPCELGRLFSKDVVEHSCDASHRGSGAPILIEDAAGDCLVAALHVGEIESEPGRPAYRDDINANVAVLAIRFAAAVAAVARELNEGLDADEIAADLAAHPPRRPAK